MKYILNISGRGADHFLHKLNSDQYDKLSEIDLEDIEHDQVSEILEIDSILETDHIITGAFTNPESVYIKVENESGEITWETDDVTEIGFDHRQLELDSDYLVVQDYMKGDFQQFEIYTENFDPEKLELIITEIGYQLECITRIKYDGQEIESCDLGDTSSKGIYYFIV
jgi:hypothetical protein